MKKKEANIRTSGLIERLEKERQYLGPKGANPEEWLMDHDKTNALLYNQLELAKFWSSQEMQNLRQNAKKAIRSEWDRILNQLLSMLGRRMHDAIQSKIQDKMIIVIGDAPVTGAAAPLLR